MTTTAQQLSATIGRGDRTATVPTGLWLGTQHLPAAQGKTFKVVDPATEEVIAEVADASSKDWMTALSAADAAQKAWAKTTPRRRSEILRAIFEEISRREQDFATVMSMENGKPFAEGRGEVAMGNEFFRWFSEEAVRSNGRTAPLPNGGGNIVVTRRPVGPCLAITPWNFPFAMACRKLAPALAAGCTMVIKPAEETPLSMLLLGEVLKKVFTEFSVPEGVVSIIPTMDAAGLSSELMGDSRLRKVTFTGSTAVGKILVEQSARNLQRTSMELGGNAAFVVAKDADIEKVADYAMQARLRNGGQVCIAANRFIVHEDVAEAFVSALKQRMAELKQGHGMDEGTTLGPLINRAQRDRVAKLVQQAKDAGAQAFHAQQLPGETSDSSAGFFYPATILTEVPEEADILREEIFGPVATISTFSNLDEAIDRANSTEFGLAAYGFSENVHTAQRLAEELEAGMIAINKGVFSDAAAPFGGIKQSGFGREGGTEGIEEFQEITYVAWI